MSKKLFSAMLILNVVFYVVIVCIGILSRPADIVPQSVDDQVLTVEQAFVNGSQTPVSLPAYFDVDGELRLLMSLSYRFSGNTAPSFIVQANHSFMTILLDGQEIYRVEPQERSLGNYFTHVPLPSQLDGAELEVLITVPEGGIDRIEFPAPVVADEAVYLRQQLLHDTPSLVLSSLILFCGLFVTGLSIAGRKHVPLHRMILQGLLAICCAAYFLCETFSVVYLASSAWTVYFIDMLSFSLLTPLFFGLIVCDLNGWRRRLIQAMVVWGYLNAAVVAILGVSGLVELRTMLPLTHCVQLLSILSLLACLVYRVVKHQRVKGLWVYGLIVVGAVLDLALFYFEQKNDNMFFTKIAISLYFVQQMYMFVRLLMRRSADKARESYYKMLALQDSLTGCFSRAAFEHDKTALNRDVMHTVFSVDLNNLKKTNDLHGHSTGDRLIHAMGDVLKQTFASGGRSYRVGGDEFWVICDGITADQAHEKIATMRTLAAEYNAKQEIPVQLSYAVGMCSTDETDGDLSLAIDRADARMYAHKQQLKGEEEQNAGQSAR